MNLTESDDKNILSISESSKDVRKSSSKPFRIKILGDLISSRREFLDMSLMCDKKLQWYERVTKQGKQLLSRWKVDRKMNIVSSLDAKLLGKSLSRTFPKVPKTSQENNFQQNQKNSEASTKLNSADSCQHSKAFSTRKSLIAESDQGTINDAIGDRNSSIMTPGKADQGGVPAVSEKAGKIMKKIQEARQSLPSGGKTSLVNGKRKPERVDEKSSPGNESRANALSLNEIRQGERAILKNGRLKNEYRQLLMAKELYEDSTAEITSFNMAPTPNLATATTRRKWAIEEAKALRNPMVVDDMLAGTTVRDPSSYQEEFWCSVRAMWRTNGEKDVAAPNLSVIAESDSEPLPFSVFSPEGQTNLPAFNRIRPRAGRSIKRRKRDLKAAAARRVDCDSSASSISPGSSPSPIKFVIPDVPYDISEALSMDVIDAAYDFIHNG